MIVINIVLKMFEHHNQPENFTNAISMIILYLVDGTSLFSFSFSFSFSKSLPDFSYSASTILIFFFISHALPYQHLSVNVHLRTLGLLFQRVLLVRMSNANNGGWNVSIFTLNWIKKRIDCVP